MKYASLLLFVFYVTSAFGQNNSTKKIIFGSDYDYPPYEFINKKGEYDGFHIDLIHAIGKEMGYQVEIRLGEWASIREELEDPNGQINVADMFYSEERTKKLNFVPYHSIISYVMVRNKKKKIPQSIFELKNQAVVVTARSIADEYLKEKEPTIKRIQSVTELHALKMLASQKYNYALINQYMAYKFIKEHELSNLAVSDKFIFSKNLSFVVKKGNKILAKDIEEGMNRVRENGIYSELYLKWFDNEKESYTLSVTRIKWLSFILLIIIVLVISWIFTLDRQVKRKTRKLRKEIRERQRTQKLLFDKNTELEKRNYELDKFVYSVSHNVRSPIASALGLVEIIQSEFGDNKKLSFYVLNIGKSLRKLDYYSDKILKYVTNKNYEVSKKRIHFDRLLTQLIGEMKYLDGAEEMIFEKEITQEVEFYSDKNRIYMILECLIANSVEYRAERHEKSFVRIVVNSTKKQTSIIVQDNSQGIEEEQLEKVFEMFYRGNQRSQRTGLGLYVVKQTIEQLGGTLKLESKYKVGSTFKLQIPNLEK